MTEYFLRDLFLSPALDTATYVRASAFKLNIIPARHRFPDVPCVRHRPWPAMADWGCQLDCLGDTYSIYEADFRACL